MNVPLTPLRCLDRALDQFADEIGVVCGGKTFTYAQFGARCQRLATALPKHGIEKGDRVAFLSFNTHKLLEGYYGVVQAQAVVMPLNVRLTAAELTAILDHSGAKMLCFEHDFAAIVEKLRKSCREVKHWVSLEGGHHLAELHYEQLIDEGRSEPADIFAYDEDAAAELFYTSGSTGTPKGVVLTHRNLYLHALMLLSLPRTCERPVDLHTIPLYHANGWGRPQLSTLMGWKQVMVRRFEPPTVFKLIEQHKATDMSVVPVMANMLLNAPELNAHDLSSMKRIMIGGAASSPELIARMEAAFGCEVVAGYGLTETSPVLTCGNKKPTVTYRDETDRHRRQAMAGWPIAGTKVRVVDLYDNPVPRDGKTIGEVVAQGDNIMEGYFKEPAATREVIRDNWFRTGDMAVWDEHGYIHIVDRKKEIIISGGENISSLEVERAIFSHPAVLECAVVAAPDDRWGEVPAALVVLKDGRTLSEEELLAYLEERLGKFKLPRIIEFLDHPLPKTGTGKIRKMVLKERFWVGKEKRVQ
jgi:fatty-acyl-CoA synthase